AGTALFGLEGRQLSRFEGVLRGSAVLGVADVAVHVRLSLRLEWSGGGRSSRVRSAHRRRRRSRRAATSSVRRPLAASWQLALPSGPVLFHVPCRLANFLLFNRLTVSPPTVACSNVSELTRWRAARPMIPAVQLEGPQ